MTGRSDGRLVRPSTNPSVTVGLTLGTSSPALSASSPDQFYITVTARILTSPKPSHPITLQTHPNPLEGLSNRSFHNISCIDHSDKHIEIYPWSWPHYIWDSGDLRSSWDFLTIPSSDSGDILLVRHEVPRDKILAANLQAGDRYKVRLTDKCLGTRWWTFKSLEELEGVRLQAFKDFGIQEMERQDPEWAAEREREQWEKFGDGPVESGEDPKMLAMVVEGPDAEFEIA